MIAESLPRPHDPERDAERNQTLRAELEELRRTRLEQLAQLAQLPAEPDGVDELAVARVASLRRALADVDAALGGLEDGSYGVCARCRRQIRPERLEIVPHARYCVACQQRHESRRA